MRIAIIALAGLVLFALVSSWIGMPRSEIAFLAGGYALSGAFIWWLLPIALASGASMTIRVGLARISHGKPYDSKALRRACWAFRKNEDIRRLGQLAASESIPADLLTRVEKALPRLEVSAVRKFALLRALMFACMIGGAICRFISSARFITAEHARDLSVDEQRANCLPSTRLMFVHRTDVAIDGAALPG